MQRNYSSFLLTSFFLVTFLLAGFTSFSQRTTVNIPDANFRARLIRQSGISAGTNDSVIVANISAIINLSVSSSNITNLTGIEAFTSLTALSCSYNQLTELNVSENTALTDLGCSSNQLTELNVSENTALTNLICSSNQLTELNVSANTALTNLGCHNNQLTELNVSANTALTDLGCSSNQLTELNVSENTALTNLICENNQLTELNVSANTALTGLYCDRNQLTELNVSANTALTGLYCYSNQLTELNVSANTALTNLRCYSNQLTELNVSANTYLTNLICYSNQLTELNVSANTYLTELYCSKNQLTSLNVSANTVLTNLSCYSNQLSSLNVKNGNNRSMSLTAFSNYSLRCVQVDDAEWSTNNWSVVNGYGFSEDCNSLSLMTQTAGSITTTSAILGGYIVSDGEDAVIERGIVYSLSDANIIIENTVDATKKSNGRGKGIFSENIIGLAEGTQYYYRAYATNGSGTKYGSIKNFNTISATTATTTTILDYKFEQALIELGYDSGTLDGIVLTSNIQGVTYLDVSDRGITDLAGIEHFTALTSLRCYSNQLTSLDVSSNTALTFLSCSSNQLTSLDVSTNTDLTDLICSSNQLTELNVSANTDLTFLRCSSNQLTSLNVKNKNNNTLTTFEAINNPNLTCIQVDNVAQSSSNTGWNIDATASFSENCATASNKNFKLSGISISPNPTAGILNITVVEKADYRLLNIRGQTLKTGVLNSGKNKVNISPFAKGIYLLNLKTSKGSFTEKIVKN